MNKFLILAITAIFIFSACNKQSNDTLDKSTMRTSTINPFEYIGIDHNDALDAVYKTSGFETLTSLECVTIIRQYIVDKYSLQDFPTPRDFQDELDTSYNDSQTLIDVAKYYYSQKEFDMNQLQYFEELNSIMKKMTNMEGYNNDLDNLEGHLKNDINISTVQKEIIWGSISLARHSGEYWYPLYYSKKSTNKEQTGNWLGHTCADVKGFVKGVFTHSASGNVWHAATTSATCNSRAYDAFHNGGK